MQLVKTPEGRRKIEKDMLDVANEIVGNVGPKVDRAFMDYRLKDIAFFCIDRKLHKSSDIMDVWTKWIKAYCCFKKLDRPENAELLDDPALIIRWLQKPEICPEGKQDEYIKAQPDDEHWRDWIGGKKPDIENPSYVRIRGYLSIYRLDHYTAEIR